MEQPAVLNITQSDTAYRFRLELADDASMLEASTELTIDVRERLRRVLHAAMQQVSVRSQSSGQDDGKQGVKPQTAKFSVVNNTLHTLGVFLFETLLPASIQDALSRLNTPLLLATNTPEVPWEVLFDTRTNRYLCHAISIGRLPQEMVEQSIRNTRLGQGGTRKIGVNRRETQQLAMLLLVNPTSERPTAEEEIVALCTDLPENISRTILYRQQANQLELRLRMGTELPHVLHYAGPNPLVQGGSEPVLALAGNSRLEGAAVENLLQSLPKKPLFVLSFYGESRQGRTGSGPLSPVQQERDELQEQLADNLLAMGAGAVILARWPVSPQRTREFMTMFYQDIADGVALGEAVRRTRVAMKNSPDLSPLSFVLYGDPTQRLVTVSLANKERVADFQQPELHRDALDDDTIMPPLFPTSGSPDRRFLRAVLDFALNEARRMHKDYLGTPHLFIALTKLDGGCTQDALRSLGFSAKQVRDVIRLALGSGKANSDTPILPTRRCKEILLTAERNAASAGSSFVDERAIALSVLSEGDGVTHELLTKMGINPARLSDLIQTSDARALLELVPPAEPLQSSVDQPTGIISDVSPKSGSLLEKLGRDLTKQAANKQLTPLIGREKEIRQLMQTMMLKDRNNPILIGDSGVGKTTIVGGLAQRIIEDKVPRELRDKRIIELSASSLVAGTKYRGEFEERLLKILEEAETSGDIILFIDEMHLLIGTGRAADGSIDAAGILKPALAGGRLRCIGATTPQEYRTIEKDAALERRLRPIQIEEPTPDEALAILTGMRELYEEHHHTTIADDALQAAVHLSVQYRPNLRLPDKACSVLDEACSQARVSSLEQEETDEPQTMITAAMIAEIISIRTGIPVRAPGPEERERLLSLEDRLKARVIGQDEAVRRVAQAIQVARAGLKPRNRPSGVFFFLGPTGVGKTELARALAAEVFGTPEALVRVDMSEYMEKHEVSRMIGSPPGYVGYDQEGQLTGKLRRRPHCVVLLDEVEKAHPEVFDLFLQVFDAGRLTDGQGHTVDAQHAIWIMTSNVGTDMLGRSMPHGFRASTKGNVEEMQRDQLLERLRQTFRPEFLNRIDEVVIFHALSQEQAHTITRLQMNELGIRLLEQGLVLNADESVIDLLCKEGFSQTQGARPLRRVIERLLTVPLSMRILLADIPQNGEVYVTAVDGQLAIDIREPTAKQPRVLVDAEMDVGA